MNDETTKTRAMQKAGTWLPGQSGNPAGRPMGSRQRLTDNFIAVLAADFDAHGAETIVKLREMEPGKYAQIIGQLLPKSLEVAIQQHGPLDKPEMQMLRRLVDVIEACAPSDPDKDVVFALIEEALRSYYAKTIASDI
jgi:hypothetical protein